MSDEQIRERLQRSDEPMTFVIFHPHYGQARRYLCGQEPATDHTLARAEVMHLDTSVKWTILRRIK